MSDLGEHQNDASRIPRVDGEPDSWRHRQNILLGCPKCNPSSDDLMPGLPLWLVAGAAEMTHALDATEQNYGRKGHWLVGGE